MNSPPSPPEAPFVELDAVEKRFSEEVVALKGMDLSLQRGDFCCLVGPSGCGKSTALRLIAGLARPSSGHLRWSGSQDLPREGQIGFVFQEPTLMPWRRVWENVWLPLQLRGMSRSASQDAVDEAIELVGLTDAVRMFPRQLSGGMKMRVSIARALVTKPALMLMDEPFAALDESTRFRLNDDLLRLWHEQRWTVLFVTHSVYESVYLGSRIATMTGRPGRVASEIEVNAGHPRDESFRRTSEYADCCAKVSRLLATGQGVS